MYKKENKLVYTPKLVPFWFNYFEKKYDVANPFQIKKEENEEEIILHLTMSNKIVKNKKTGIFTIFERKMDEKNKKFVWNDITPSLNLKNNSTYSFHLLLNTYQNKKSNSHIWLMKVYNSDNLTNNIDSHRSEMNELFKNNEDYEFFYFLEKAHLYQKEKNISLDLKGIKNLYHSTNYENFLIDVTHESIKRIKRYFNVKEKDFIEIKKDKVKKKAFYKSGYSFSLIIQKRNDDLEEIKYYFSNQSKDFFKKNKIYIHDDFKLFFNLEKTDFFFKNKKEKIENLFSSLNEIDLENRIKLYEKFIEQYFDINSIFIHKKFSSMEVKDDLIRNNVLLENELYYLMNYLDSKFISYKKENFEYIKQYKKIKHPLINELLLLLFHHYLKENLDLDYLQKENSEKSKENDDNIFSQTKKNKVVISYFLKNQLTQIFNQKMLKIDFLSENFDFAPKDNIYNNLESHLINSVLLKELLDLDNLKNEKIKKAKKNKDGQICNYNMFLKVSDELLFVIQLLNFFFKNNELTINSNTMPKIWNDLDSDFDKEFILLHQLFINKLKEKSKQDLYNLDLNNELVLIYEKLKRFYFSEIKPKLDKTKNNKFVNIKNREDFRFNFLLKEKIKKRIDVNNTKIINKFIRKYLLEDKFILNCYNNYHCVNNFNKSDLKTFVLFNNTIKQNQDLNFFFKDNYDNYKNYFLLWLHKLKFKKDVVPQQYKLINNNLLKNENGEYEIFSSHNFKDLKDFEENIYEYDPEEIILDKSTKKILNNHLGLIKFFKLFQLNNIDFMSEIEQLNIENVKKRNFKLFVSSMYKEKTKYGLFNNILNPLYLIYRNKNFFLNSVEEDFKKDYENKLKSDLFFSNYDFLRIISNYKHSLFNDIDYEISQKSYIIQHLEEKVEQFIYLLKILFERKYLFIRLHLLIKNYKKRTNKINIKNKYIQKFLELYHYELENEKNPDEMYKKLISQIENKSGNLNRLISNIADVSDLIFARNLIHKNDGIERLINLDRDLHEELRKKEFSERKKEKIDLLKYVFVKEDMIAYIPKNNYEVFMEGKDLHHCIYTVYYNNIKNGKYLPIFIRELHNKLSKIEEEKIRKELLEKEYEDVLSLKTSNRSTLGLSINTKKDNCYYYDQHRTYCNGLPNEKHLAFVKQVIDDMRKNHNLKVYWE